MQEQDIPLLTDVHAFSGQSIRPLSLNADLIAEILATIKPQLKRLVEDELTEAIKHLVAQEVNHSVTSAKQSIVDCTSAAADKVRADFATEIPRMMHVNAEIVKADLVQALSQMQSQEVAEVQTATLALQDKVKRLHEDLLIEHQASLAAELAVVYQGLEAQSQAELALYLQALQLKSKQQLALDIDDAFPALYQSLSHDWGVTLKQELDVIADVTKNEFKQQLNTELPEIERNLIQNIKTEIEKLLDSVRLIFNK